MAASNDDLAQVKARAVATLVPRLAYQLVERLNPNATSLHVELDGTLLSADISGFTTLTEQLADRGRVGAELITTTVNSCFFDLIGTGEHHGGDVIKFGGDAVLMIFTGEGHRGRAAAAGQEMQFALRRNSLARHHDLQMTVGIGDGPFDAMIVGDQPRDLLLCGPATTEVLHLEDAAEAGEVLVTPSVIAALAERERSTGQVLYRDVGTSDAALPEIAVETMAAFVPPSLLGHFADYVDLGAEFRQAAIGFVMIGGVDEHISRHGGSATASALEAFLDRLHEALDATGSNLLHSDSAIGGVKLLVGAGVPNAVDEPADALLYAALAIQRIESPFVVKQGLSIGAVYAGFLGAPHRRTFSVMSDSVNTAARMLGPAGPGEILAVDAVVQRSRMQVLGQPLIGLQVKGKATTVDAFRVEGLVQSTDKHHANKSAFAGREREHSELNTALTTGSAATIFGPAGSGKTRLRDEAIGTAGSLGAAAGRYLASSPYGALWSAMRTLLGIDRDAGPHEAGALLVDRLAVEHPQLADMAALLAPVFGAETTHESEAVRAIEPAFRREALQRSVTQLLAEQDPSLSVIVVEDTQWLDDATLDLIDHLSAVASEHSWVVVQTLRTTTSQPEPSPANDRTGHVGIVLGPLDDTAIELIITSAIERPLIRHEIDRLVSRAQGNPLFALELAAAAERPGGEVPESIEELIAARIDRVPSAQRMAVRLASVLGARFARATFAALVEATGFDVPTDLSAIGDIFQLDDEYVQFRELLYRDVAYASLPFAQRKRWHRMVGEYLLDTTTDVDAIAALLSQHFFSAGDRRRCWTHSIAAAERAERQYSPTDAAVLYKRALDFKPRGADPIEQAAAQHGLGQALVAAGSLDDAHTAFGKARRVYSDASDQQRMLCLQADCRNRLGRYSDALRTYSRVLNDDEVDAENRITALIGRGSVLYKLSRHRESYDLGHQALILAKANGDREGEARAWNLISANGERLGSSDRTEATERALAIFQEIGSLSEEAEIRNNIGVTAQLDGDLQSASESYRASLDIKQRVGDLSGAAMVQMNLAEVELDQSMTEGVDELLASCIAVFERSGFTVGLAYSQGLRGRCALLTGDPQRASELLHQASDVFMKLNAEGYAADMDMLLIEAYIDLDRPADAQALLDINRERLTRDIFDNPAAVEARLLELENN